MMNKESLVWQLADATFPAGGLAQSGGVEAANKWDELGNLHRLEAFIHDQLTQTAHAMAPLLRAACLCPANALAIDRFCQSFLSNHVANRASRAQGKAFLLSAGAAFGLSQCRKLRDEIQCRGMFGHFPIVFGVVTAALGIDVDQSTRLFLYLGLRSLISSSVRLSVLGPLEGQALQYRLGTLVDGLASRCREFDPSTATQTAPLVELFQASQDRLYSRLFQS